MSVIKIVSDAQCKHCKFHRNAYIKRADGTKTKKWVGHCFVVDNAPVQKPAASRSCDKFIPWWM